MTSTETQIQCSGKVLPQIYTIFIKIQPGEAGTRTKVHLSQWRQTQKKIRPQPLGMLLLIPWLWEPAASCNPNLQLQVSHEEHLISWHDSHRMQKSTHFLYLQKECDFSFVCWRGCLCAHVYVCLWCGCVCGYVCRRQKSMSDIFFNCIPHCFIHTGSPWTWSSWTWLNWLGSE